ncbi:MAG: CRISPR-associated endonuclease Cas3'' [Acidobacteriota bacterium]
MKLPQQLSNDLFAHAAKDQAQRHRLVDHLRAVAEYAGNFAETFGAGAWGYLVGLWHDVGKASEAFQAYLKAAQEDYHQGEIRGSVDHSSAGAQHAVKTLGLPGHLLAFPIAGHHAGLPDSISEGSCLERRLRKKVETWTRVLDLIPPAGELQLPPFLQRALERRHVDPKGAAFSLAFFVRMLFSCLVDADFLDTEAFLNRDQRMSRTLWPEDVLARMEHALERFVSQLPAATAVDRQRNMIREACVAAAEKEPGFFSLTVPTGGGKTLSSLAFALRHAAIYKLRRIIYVAPFTTIIEQNADVFRRVFAPLEELGLPDVVVEHHSNLNVEDQSLASRLAAENWDAPLIVTTSVQFYESLFSNRPSQCRKLHNTVNSVVILDEAQKLPVDYLAPCLMALRELVAHYRCTVVLCTATQPAIQKSEQFPLGLNGVREIIQEPKKLYLAFRRVEVGNLGTLSDEELAGRLLEEPQVMCVVNTRRHARELFQRISAQSEAIHLSAAMCPAHRSEVLERVRERLALGKTCRVIATQLVEAGVDLDFPVVYRSLAGLDSLAQAAGRCNRNGRLSKGRVFLFRSQHDQSEAFLRDTANVTAQLAGDGVNPALYEDLLSLEAVEHYFRLYYWTQRQRWDARRILDQFGLQNRRDLPFLFNFESAARAFRLIEEFGRPVVVPWGEKGRKLYDELTKSGHLERKLFRDLQRYTVQIPDRVWRENVGRALEVVHDEITVLAFPEIHYDENLGVNLEGSLVGPEVFIT